MRGRRSYPVEGDSRGCSSGCGQRCLGLSWTKNHGMLTSSWAWRSVTCTWKMLKRIWEEVSTELQTSWRSSGGTGMHCRHWWGCCRTRMIWCRPGLLFSADLRTCASGDGEPVPAQWSLERQAYGDSMTVWDGDEGVAESIGKGVVWWGAAEGRIGLWLGPVW